MRATSGLRNRPTVGGHRIDVVEQQRVRRQVIHVVAQVDQHRDGAQRAEDATRPQGIAYTLLHAVALGNLNVQLIGIQPTLLEGGDYVIGAFHGFSPVGGSFHLSRQTTSVDNGLHQITSLVQSLRVDVHQGNGAFLQRWRQQDVAAQVAGEDSTTRADKSDFGHRITCVDMHLSRINFVLWQPAYA